MGIWRPGGQRVGVERTAPVLDGDGNPTYDELGDPIVTTTVAWVDNCLFEVPRTPEEYPGIIETTSETCWAILPIANDEVVPAVDDADADASFPFFDTNGNPTINSQCRLVHNGLRYEMRGDAALEEDIRGRADHVFCRCERNG